MMSFRISATLEKPPCAIFFFFNDTATTEIYTLSLHDALPISTGTRPRFFCVIRQRANCAPRLPAPMMPTRTGKVVRSEEHTSELQSPCNLVCRLLLEKKKTTTILFDSMRLHLFTSLSGLPTAA